MSTKLYSGYRLKLNGTPMPIFANEVRSVMNPLLRKVWQSTLCNMAIDAVHRRQLAGAELLPDQPHSQASPWSSVVMHLEDGVKDQTYFSLVLFTDPTDLAGEWTYLTVHTPRQWEAIFNGLFTASHQMESFGYWDNADKPEELTDEEWQNRYDVWDRIGVLESSPVDCGISIEMFSDSWWDLEAMAPMWGDDTALREVFANIIKDPDFLDKRSKRLAPDVDGYQAFLSQSENPTSATEVIAFLMDSSRSERRNQLAEAIKQIITVPSWEDILRSGNK